MCIFPHLDVILDPLVGLHLSPVSAVRGRHELVQLGRRLQLSLTDIIQPRSRFKFAKMLIPFFPSKENYFPVMLF